jgi:hypothetical protein
MAAMARSRVGAPAVRGRQCGTDSVAAPADTSQRRDRQPGTRLPARAVTGGVRSGARAWSGRGPPQAAAATGAFGCRSRIGRLISAAASASAASAHHIHV